MENQYPNFSTRMSSENKDYPNLSQINLGESAADMRYDAQGSKILNQEIQKGQDYFRDSSNRMYDAQYDSESAKNYQQPISNPPIQPNQYVPNNIPDGSLNVDQRYDAQNSKIYNQDIQSDEYKNLSTNYNSQDPNKQFGSNNIPPNPMNNYYPYPQQYEYGVPHGPRMFPHFPHCPHFPHFPHAPYYPAPAYPPVVFPMEGDFGY